MTPEREPPAARRDPAHSLRFVDSWASVLLDLLRAIAALLVVLEHWRNIFFVDFPPSTDRPFLWALPYALTGAGHQAVVVFFLLSGFLVGGTVLRTVESGRWDWRSYLLRRSTRLWIVLLPALLLCFFWDSLGLHLGVAPALYHGGVNNHVVDDISRLLSPRLLLANLFFLQGTYTQPFGSDGALWSLAYEFWYYILFPLGLITFVASAARRHRLICLALFAATAWFVGSRILLYFPIWLAGVLLLRIPSPRLSPAAAQLARIIAAAIYVPIFFFLAKNHRLSSVVSDYVLTIFTFLLLWILLTATGRHPIHSASVRSTRELARFSYTLYAVHTPLLIFLASLLVHDARWQPTPAHLLIAIAVLLTTIAYSFVIATLTEFRTDALRTRIERLFGFQVAPPALPSDPTADPS